MEGKKASTGRAVVSKGQKGESAAKATATNNNNTGNGTGPIVLDISAFDVNTERAKIKTYLLAKKDVILKRASETAAKVRYIGLDLNLLLKVMISKSQNKTADEIFMSDVVDLCTLFAERGSKLTNKTDRMSEEGRQAKSLLVTRYGITGTGSGQPGPTTITLARIAILFPEVVAMIMNSGIGRDFNSGNAFDSLPRGLRWTSAPALIPRGWEGCLSTWRDWNSNFIEITRPGVEEDTLSELKLKSLEYAAISHNSEWIDDDTRIAIMLTLGLKKDIVFIEKEETDD